MRLKSLLASLLLTLLAPLPLHAQATAANTTTGVIYLESVNGSFSFGTDLTIADSAGSFQVKQYEPTPNAPTVGLAGAGAGLIENGAHTYVETCKTAGGETTYAAGNVVTVADNTVNGKVTVTLAACSSVATGRNLYRSKAGTTTPLFLIAASPVIGDGKTTTTYTDNIADASLQAGTAPTTNTAFDVRWTESPSQLKLLDGTGALPALSFGSDATKGLYSNAANQLAVSIAGAPRATFTQGGINNISDAGTFSIGAAADVVLARDAAGTLALKNGVNAQKFYLYSSFTDANNFGRAEISALGSGGLNLMAHNVVTSSNANSGDVILGTNNANKFLVKGGSAASQIATAQGVAPTCATNCGTSPTLTGSDTDFRLVMGGTGSPASAFIITFNGTWAAAPVCVGNMSLTGMAVGKLPLTLVTTTTTLTVVTNGVAPANSDAYSFHCFGTQ